MKRIIRATTISDKSLDAIYKQFGRNNPDTGCSYITQDGTFINIYPKLDVHEDLCWWVEDELGEKLDYEDEEYFIRECGWVRCRKDPHMTYIELPATIPTSKQWYAIEEWLMYCEDRFSQPFTIDISVVDDISAVNTPYEIGKELFSEDILKIMKRYYSSGKLYSTTEVDSLTSVTCTDEIDQSDFDEDMVKITSSAETLDDRYEVVSQDSQWYIVEIETGDVYDGPFDTEEEALSYFGEDDTDDYYEEEEIMTEEEMAAMQHEKFLSWFDSYANRLPGKIYIDGYIGTRNEAALERFLKAFLKSHPDADLSIDTRYDSESTIYIVV